MAIVENRFWKSVPTPVSDCPTYLEAAQLIICIFRRSYDRLHKTAMHRENYTGIRLVGLAVWRSQTSSSTREPSIPTVARHEGSSKSCVQLRYRFRRIASSNTHIHESHCKSVRGVLASCASPEDMGSAEKPKPRIRPIALSVLAQHVASLRA